MTDATFRILSGCGNNAPLKVVADGGGSPSITTSASYGVAFIDRYRPNSLERRNGCIRICLRRRHARKRKARRAFVIRQGIGDLVDRHRQRIVGIQSPPATSVHGHRDAAAHRIILSSKGSEQIPFAVAPG